MLHGRVERVGEAGSFLVLGEEKLPVSTPDHRDVLEAALKLAAPGRIEAAKRLLAQTPQVAVFDTAFRQTLPPEASRYAIPAALAEACHRRYGCHGISHAHVSRKATPPGPPIEKIRLVTLHPGNGRRRRRRHLDGLYPLRGALHERPIR